MSTLLVESKAPSAVRIGDVVVGGGPSTFIAGPCAVESAEQALRIARRVVASGARIFRGGAFKPRTSPYAFQGLGVPGLEILRRVREETGLLICTEALDTECVASVAAVADIIQIGSRNMDNPSLLRRAGETGRPVLLKRGMVATIEELLFAAEYVLATGNDNVILCERGVRTSCSAGRNTLDLSAVLRLRARTSLPIIVDPSHAAGVREDVVPLALAAAAVGVDGIIVEVHDRPDEALCDGPQAISPEAFADMVRRFGQVAQAIGREAPEHAS